MKSNIGMTDRALRMFLGISVAMLLVFQNSIWAMVGLIPFITGIVGICPLYSILGINTDKSGAHS